MVKLPFYIIYFNSFRLVGVQYVSVQYVSVLYVSVQYVSVANMR